MNRKYLISIEGAIIALLTFVFAGVICFWVCLGLDMYQSIKLRSAPAHAEQQVDSKKNIYSARKVEMTAYTAKRGAKTASTKSVRPGIIAVSRDLFDEGYVFGRKVYVHGLGIYEIDDLMATRHKNRIDIFLGTEKEAIKFGIKTGKISLLGGDE